MNQQQATKTIVDAIRKISGDYSADQYQTYLAAFTPDEFDAYVKRLETREELLVLEEPVFGKSKISFENNLKVAREFGRDFWDYLIYESDRPGVPNYRSAVKCLVLDLPIKRPVQMAYKKISAPTNYTVVNELTGQVSGHSKGASITTPEIALLDSMPLTQTLEELLKGRGGDKGYQEALYANLVKTGTVSLANTRGFSTGVQSINTLYACLKSMHIEPLNMID